MPSNEIEPMLTPEGVDLLTEYRCEVRPLKTGGRRDVAASNQSMTLALQGDESFVDRLRRFFAEMDAEIDHYRHDPIATAQALARVEALLADVRYVRDRLMSTTAASLNEHKVRTLTVQGVVTVEASSELKRSEWQHHRLLVEMLERLGFSEGIVSPHTGEVWTVANLAAVLLEWFRPEWKLTQLKNAGLDPNDFCTVERDEHHKPMRTPTVRIVDNRAKGAR